MNKRKIHNWLVGIWFLYEIFLESYLPANLLEHSKFISPIIGLLLLVISIYYLIRRQDENRNKTFDEITSQENLGNYLQLFFLLMFTGIDVYGSFGIWVKIGLYIIAMISIITVMIKEWTLKKELITGVIIGHIFLGYFLYSWTKNTYVRHYGNEIIGSYWAKPNFRTKYMVKLSKSSDSQKVYVLPAIVHVFSETYESDYPQEDRWGLEYYESYTEEYIILEKVFFNNGGYLTFDDCNLEFGEKIYCWDQDEGKWYIELTEEKVE